MNLRTFRIITFGCRVNQAESRQMGEQLVNVTMKQCNNEAIVDIVIINTCCVTNKAEREVRKEIRRVKRENPNCFLVVCGCWVNKLKVKNAKHKTMPTKKSSILDQSIGTVQNSKILKLIDLLVDNQQKEKIGQILKKQFDNLTIKQFSNGLKYQDKYGKSKKAMVKIQEGCDNFCTYCLVPYVRGESKSRKIKDIVKEIKELVKQGIAEVVLTGIDIASYKPSLVQLIKVILKETKIKKINFGSMGLKGFDEEFIGLYESRKNYVSSQFSSRLSSHFHIPLQSGCDVTLKRMNRDYKISNFQFLISNLKKKIPNLTFSTDIIVGFPGETKEEFNTTIRTLKTIRTVLGKQFTHIHVFRYSARKGTVAAEMEGKKGWQRVDGKEKKRRSKITESLLDKG